MPDLRTTLTPIITALGVRRVAQRAGVAQPSLSQWLAGAPRIGEERQRDLVTACRELATEDWDRANAQLRALRKL